VTSGTVWTHGLIRAIVTAVAKLIRCGTGLPSSAVIFAVTEFLAFKALQWV